MKSYVDTSTSIYDRPYMYSYVTLLRGYKHIDTETDSDGDGGTLPKLRGLGLIEFSPKGIPHGSLHFPEQVQWAGHMFMFDTCAPEAAHKYNIKAPMDRVRKLDDTETASSMIDWTLRSRTWGKVITSVRRELVPPKDKRTTKSLDCLHVSVYPAKIHRPTNDVQPLLHENTFSPLEKGEDNLLSPDVRVSYSELGTLISRSQGWPIVHVMKRLKVRLYCSARVLRRDGSTRTFWSTDTRYPYLRGQRRDMVHISLRKSRLAVAQLVAFVEMNDLPSTERDQTARAVLIRWMGVSTLSRNHQRDALNRPVCEYPLSSNHCLYEWSDIGEDRYCFRDIRRNANKISMWDHFPQTQRARAIESERRAYYDIIQYASIVDHTNISVDPSTGHMLQTIQII